MSSGPAVVPARGACKPGELSGLKDDQLLARFFQEREDAAFAVLVERYGPLVYGVCRRILNDANDAEDAFQATFLVLVRKGATLRDPGRLASWLYGVAYRTARKLRSKAALRTKSERQASEMRSQGTVDQDSRQELAQVIAIDSQLPSGCYKGAWELVNETEGTYKQYVSELTRGA